MSFFSKIISRIKATFVAVNERRRLRRAERSDLLLAHRVVSRRRLPSPSQWRKLGGVLTPTEKNIVKRSALLILAGILMIGGRWMLLHIAFVPARGGEYREGIVGSPRDINPVMASGNDVDQDIIRLVYSGLYRRDTEARLILDLAEKVDISPDGKTYTFKLRDDARFSDGRPVSADDVVFTINAIQNPAWKSPQARAFTGITASASDPVTVVIKTDKPSSYLPLTLTIGILPKHVWEDIDPASRAVADFNLKPIGSGPYKFEKFARDSQGNILSYTLKAVSRNATLLDRITFKFYDDYETALDKLTQNAVDGLNFVAPGKKQTTAQIPGVTIHTPALSQYTALFLNPKRQPILADQNIRQALAMAIDRDKIVREALGGNGERRDMPIPEGAAGTTSNITRYAFDPGAAAALLEKAGYVLAEGSSVRVKTETEKTAAKNQTPKTTTTELGIAITTINSEENVRAAEIIKEGWASVGVKTDVITVAAADIQKSAIRSRDYEALLFGEIIGPDTDPYPFWHSSQINDGLNLAFYNNRRVDELLEKARLATNDAERGKLLAEFQEIVTKDIPAIFLYQPDYSYPQTSKIRGFKVARITSPADRFANITEWYRKLKLTFK